MHLCPEAELLKPVLGVSQTTSTLSQDEDCFSNHCSSHTNKITNPFSVSLREHDACKIVGRVDAQHLNDEERECVNLYDSRAGIKCASNSIS